MPFFAVLVNWGANLGVAAGQAPQSSLTQNWVHSRFFLQCIVLHIAIQMSSRTRRYVSVLPCLSCSRSLTPRLPPQPKDSIEQDFEGKVLQFIKDPSRNFEWAKTIDYSGGNVDFRTLQKETIITSGTPVVLKNVTDGWDKSMFTWQW